MRCSTISINRVYLWARSVCFQMWIYQIFLCQNTETKNSSCDFLFFVRITFVHPRNKSTALFLNIFVKVKKLTIHNFDWKSRKKSERCLRLNHNSYRVMANETRTFFFSSSERQIQINLMHFFCHKSAQQILFQHPRCLSYLYSVFTLSMWRAIKVVSKYRFQRSLGHTHSRYGFLRFFFCLCA